MRPTLISLRASGLRERSHRQSARPDLVVIFDTLRVRPATSPWATPVVVVRQVLAAGRRGASGSCDGLWTTTAAGRGRPAPPLLGAGASSTEVIHRPWRSVLV